MGEIVRRLFGSNLYFGKRTEVCKISRYSKLYEFYESFRLLGNENIETRRISIFKQRWLFGSYRKWKLGYCKWIWSK